MTRYRVEEDSVARQPLSQPLCTIDPSHFICRYIVALDDIVWMIELSCYNGESNESGQDKESGHALHPSILKKGMRACHPSVLLAFKGPSFRQTY